MTIDLVALRKVMLAAGELVAGERHSTVVTKSPLDYVTDLDLRVDAFLTEQLEGLTPGVPVFSEERAMSRPEGAFWVIDPVDGTHNMMAGIPHYAICAALFDGTQALSGSVLDIVGGRLYVAEKDKGAAVNGQELRLRGEPSTLMGLSSGAMDAFLGHPDIYEALRRKGKIRNLGSQSLHLCKVADGQFGFTISQEARFWDDAAGRLIAEEAGASYRALAADSNEAFLDLAFTKKPLRSVCAHPDLFPDLENLLSKMWPAPL